MTRRMSEIYTRHDFCDWPLLLTSHSGQIRSLNTLHNFPTCAPALRVDFDEIDLSFRH